MLHRSRTGILIIDEAHLLDHDQLESIRMMTSHPEHQPRPAPPGGATYVMHTLTANDTATLTLNDRQHDRDVAEITGLMTRAGNWPGGLRWIGRQTDPRWKNRLWRNQ